MRLNINQSVEIEIRAKCRWNETNIEIFEGEKYKFTAIGMWTDFFITKNANGYSNLYMKLFKKWKRSKEHLWFALIGTLNKNENECFLIGENNNIQFSKTGKLYCFANDANAFYWNNFGKLNLQIIRIS